MKQKTKVFSLLDYKLALNGDNPDLKNYGVGKIIKNLNVARTIKSENCLVDFASFIEPNYANNFMTALSSIVGEVIEVYGFETFDGQEFVEYIVFCSSDYKLFYYTIGSQSRTISSLNSIQLNAKPIFDTFVKGDKNYLIICSQADEMWVWDGVENPYEVLDAPKISSMAVGLDRLFIATKEKPYSVLYSDDTDPTNWTMSAGDAGEINFTDNMGKVVKVFALDNYIFVIRQYGIVKIYGGKNDNDFTISRTFTSTGKIYDNTAVISGDYIIFLSSEGLYKFDGLSTKRICEGLDKVINGKENCFAICQNNNYYLVCSAYDSIENNTLAIINLDNEYAENFVCGINFVSCFKLNFKEYQTIGFINFNQSKTAKLLQILCKNTTNLPNCKEFLYKTQKISMLPIGANKALKTLSINTKNDVCVKIATEKQDKIFNFVGKDELQRIVLSIKCNCFEIELSGNDGADISAFEIEYGYAGGDN